MLSSELFHNNQSTINALFFPVSGQEIAMYTTQIIVTNCDIHMSRSELLQTNGQCTIMTIFCPLQLTKFTMHRTQTIVTICHTDMVRSELFKTNTLLPNQGLLGDDARYPRYCK